MTGRAFISATFAIASVCQPVMAQAQMPAQPIPAQTAPAQTAPVQPRTAQASSGQTTTVQTPVIQPLPTVGTAARPVSTTPSSTQTAPIQTTPAQTAPAQTTSAQTIPAQTAPAQTVPAETQVARTVPPPPPQYNGEPYRINAGDELEIYVWGEQRLQRTVRVLPDGNVAFPLVGQVYAQGRLPSELEQIFSQQLAGQYRGQVPQVTVSVIAPSGMQFSIMGRVKSPGTFTPGRYLNVLEALSMAGGPADFANLNDIVILRKEGTSIRPIPVRVGALFKTGANSSDVDRAKIVRIETGDTIIVP